MNQEAFATPPPVRPTSAAPWLLAVAMLYPAALTWVYFVALAGGPGPANSAQKAVYLIGKTLQFGLPIFFLLFIERRRPRLTWPRFDGLLPGLGFGLAVTALMLGLYYGCLRPMPLLARTPEMVWHKLQQEFSVDTVAGYVALVAFIAVPHSLLEEYYWRWFVFGRLRRWVPVPWANLLSSLAFMAHHVIVLYVYLPGQWWIGVVPFSLAVAAGGATWAWLYQRTGTIYSAWLSHLLVDAAIGVVGYDLLCKGGYF
jgi:membrane protease YdiL (CAAX protease family)